METSWEEAGKCRDVCARRARCHRRAGPLPRPRARTIPFFCRTKVEPFTKLETTATLKPSDTAAGPGLCAAPSPAAAPTAIRIAPPKAAGTAAAPGPAHPAAALRRDPPCAAPRCATRPTGGGSGRAPAAAAAPGARPARGRRQGDVIAVAFHTHLPLSQPPVERQSFGLGFPALAPRGARRRRAELQCRLQRRRIAACSILRIGRGEPAGGGLGKYGGEAAVPAGGGAASACGRGVVEGRAGGMGQSSGVQQDWGLRGLWRDVVCRRTEKAPPGRSSWCGRSAVSRHSPFPLGFSELMSVAWPLGSRRGASSTGESRGPPLQPPAATRSSGSTHAVSGWVSVPGSAGNQQGLPTRKAQPLPGVLHIDLNLWDPQSLRFHLAVNSRPTLTSRKN